MTTTGRCRSALSAIFAIAGRAWRCRCRATRPKRAFAATGTIPAKSRGSTSSADIFLRGRSSEVITRRGAKVHPAEVEATLSEHAAVLEAAVIGLPAADNEEEVAAFVVARYAVPAGELIAHCRARLTAHKVPRLIFFLPQLPKNNAGKVDKIALSRTRPAG